MIQTELAIPNVVSKSQWLTERKKLLQHAKELTQQRDRVSAERHRLPMVKLEKKYFFEGPKGRQSLEDLFEGAAN